MKYFYMCVAGMLVSLICAAKEKTAEVNININEAEKNSFLATPWVLVGAVIFFYLFLAVTRGDGLRSSKP